MDNDNILKQLTRSLYNGSSAWRSTHYRDLSKKYRYQAIKQKEQSEIKKSEWVSEWVKGL